MLILQQRDEDKTRTRMKIYGPGRFININTFIIACEVVLWVILNMMGSTLDSEFMIEHGAMYPTLVTEDGQWWRLFTACILHFDIAHLAGNMFAQFFMGNIFLEAVGGWKFALIYFISGIVGNALSLGVALATGDFSISAGASGAIYGIMGALFMVVIKSRGRFQSISLRRMGIALIIYIAYGFSTPGVDGWAHLGGIGAGFLLAGVMYRG